MIGALVFRRSIHSTTMKNNERNDLAWFHSLSHPDIISGTLAFALFLLFDAVLRVNTFGWFNTVKFHQRAYSIASGY